MITSPPIQPLDRIANYHVGTVMVEWNILLKCGSFYNVDGGDY